MDRRNCLRYYIYMSEKKRPNLENFDPTFHSREVRDVYGEDLAEEEMNHLSIINSTVDMRELVQSKELLKSLARIDFDLLRTIFSDHLRKYGIDPQTINFLTVERIFDSSFYKKDANNLGSYDPQTNVLFINYDNLMRWVRVLPTESEEDDKSFLITNTLVHEEVHALSKSICQGLHFTNEDLEEDMPAGLARVERVTGYRRFVAEYKTQPGAVAGDIFSKTPFWNTDLLVSLDEAVTEKFSRAVFLEYVSKHADFVDPKIALKWQEFFKSYSEGMPYSQEVQMLDALIARIARETGVDPETVWHAVLMGKLKGENLFDAELRLAFEEIFDADFLEELAYFHNASDKNRQLFIDKINSDQVTGVIKKIVSKLGFKKRAKAA